ncbi:TPA_exp: Uncharacterized protein A8136_5973 [Trichophyton benhamiae CBS 112371]|nr:TPA_exp: Uncharacterized protein A8136_5973 [Trichophyton benhamiae CBS 112371]
MPVAEENTAALPDYVLDPDAVLKDDICWRLPNLVENLVKNWEIEASFKPNFADWRTVDQECYTFSVNGGPAQSPNHMLAVGTYNAIIPSNAYYDPKHSDFAKSHKTFKRMMPTFAWEVLEVYSGPPVVVFKWRHWGRMTNDYSAVNDKGENVMVKAHNGAIDIEGLVVARVNDNLQIQSIEVWQDPMAMFRQIDPKGEAQLKPQTETELLTDESSSKVQVPQCPIAH